MGLILRRRGMVVLEIASVLLLWSSSIFGWSTAMVLDERGLGHEATVLHDHYPSRRSALLTTIISALPIVAINIPVKVCNAQQQQEEGISSPGRGGKPFAPLSALLPAARLKLVVDQMYALSLTLKDNSNSNEYKYQTLQKMNELWITRPALFPTSAKDERKSRSTTPTTAQLTTGVSSANKQQYQTIRKDLSLPDRMAAMLNQADVERQWGMLQYAESKREQGNELRAALNYYTSQLEFGSAYLLTASPMERKQMIRNDNLPSLTAVITADLDLRDLYRNDFLTAMEDAAAEIAYQIKQPSASTIEVDDVVELMDKSHSSLTKWFDLIAPIDVQEAMEAVQQ